MIRSVLRQAVRIYQQTASPDHGLMRKVRGGRPFCPQHPSCSQFAVLVLNGPDALGPALLRIFRRVSSCGRDRAVRTPDAEPPGPRARRLDPRPLVAVREELLAGRGVAEHVQHLADVAHIGVRLARSVGRRRRDGQSAGNEAPEQ